jgi:fructokinase
MKKIGIDLGGTKIESVLIDIDKGNNVTTISRDRLHTPKDDYKGILDTIQTLVEMIYLGECSYREHEIPVGVCAPGAISAKTGLVKNSNTQCLIGKPFKKDLEKTLNQKISLDNDANCFAMSESILGAAKKYDIVFGVIMGTGVGGGIIIDKKIHHGRTNIAGEWGHHILHRDGNKCYCGNNGCVETYISGPALENRWKEITGASLSLKEIMNVLDDSNSSVQWKSEFLENFGAALANVIDILDPDVIVLGGGVSNVNFLYSQGRDSVYDKVFSDAVDTPIIQNKLGDSSGVYGAALLAL